MPAATPVTTRKGISPAVLITVAVAFLAFTAVAAFLVVRMLGAGSMSGLFTRTIEPKVSGTTAAVPVSHGSTGVDATQPPPADPAPSPAPTPVPSPATEVALDTPPVAPAPEPPTTPAPEPSPAPKAPAAVRTQPAPQQPPTPRATVPPARQARPATTAPQPAQESRASVTPPPAPRVDDAPRVVERVPERREPEPPPVAVAPRAEAVALVRTYVAARNTAHAAGIRRVWPTVDDVHLRRITSAFSAPLTLGDCDVEARDAQHAVATCRLTQAGTTGPYASGQALTIRRTFVFELQRDGGVWVISGLRE